MKNTGNLLGGMAAPPEMAATSILPPCLVWRPRPRRARVNIVALGRESETYALKAEDDDQQRDASMSMCQSRRQSKTK